MTGRQVTPTPTAPFPIDPMDPRFYDDPWDAYRWLRQNAPLWWDERNEMWIVTKHADVSHISRHQGLYSAAQGVRPIVAAPMSLISMDDPEHNRLRRLVNRGFTPRMVRKLTDHMHELTAQLIDDIAERGEIEFVEDFAIHLPLIVIAELMGLDPGSRQRLYHWSDAMMAGDGHVDADDPVLLGAIEAAGELGAVLTELIEKRRTDGSTDDLVGILTQAYDEGALTLDDHQASPTGGTPSEEMTSDELLMFLFLLLIAGNETTRNSISGGLRAFTQFPEERDKLLADPGLIDLAADEIVRFVSPVMSFMRTVTTAHTYNGVDLAAGDRVFMLYQSANRDEDVFDEPDRFRIDRNPNPHLGFGIGTHYCLGANLARNQIKVVFEQLFTRLGDIRVMHPETLSRGDSTLVLFIDRLPVVFTPESARRQAAAPA